MSAPQTPFMDGTTAWLALQRLELDEQTGCWLYRHSADRHGYGRIYFAAPGEQAKSVIASRAFYQLFIGVIPDGMLVRHKCDNPPCVSPYHLEVGTYADNSRDARERGRHVHGTGVKRAKLNDEKAREVVRRVRAGETHAAVAADFGVVKGAVSAVMSGRTWTHATGIKRHGERVA